MNKLSNPPVEGFRCIRQSATALVSVTNNLGYVMAEYDDETGITKWQRVVPAPQREKVENWLLEQYPLGQRPAKVNERRVVSVPA
jgi:hypothetical protein